MKTANANELRIDMDSKIIDIQMLCTMIQAIMTEFASEYIDEIDRKLAEKVACEIDIYRGLFNTIQHLQGEILDAADELELMIHELKHHIA